MIREATIDDFNDIKRMKMLMHEESRYKIFPVNSKKLDAFIHHMIMDENALTLISSDASGFLMARMSPSYFSDCTASQDVAFYVLPEFRRNGIGLSMIDKYIEWAKSNEVNDIGLSSSTGLPDEILRKLASKYGMNKVGESYRLSYVW